MALSFTEQMLSRHLIDQIRTTAENGMQEYIHLRWQKLLACIPDTSDSRKHRALLEKAITTINANVFQAPEGFKNNYKDLSIIQVQRGIYPGWAPYEHGFYATGARNFDPALARDQTAIVTSLQNKDGWIPIMGNNYYDIKTHFLDKIISGQISMVPTLAYGAWQTYTAEHTLDFLKTVYGALSANIEWWYRNRQPRRDGVFGFAHAQEGGGDDHPRGDEKSGAIRSGMKDYLSPDACGFMLMEMKCLHNMAIEMKLEEDNLKWQSRIKVLEQRTLEVCYDRRDNMFYDVDLKTGEFVRSISPWHFTPLWAGIAFDRKLARQMIKKHGLAKLLGLVPFPIVSRDDPAYLSDVYWRGPSWPQLWLLMLNVLWWYGFEKEADMSADALIKMCEDNPYLMEIYDSRSAEGLSIPEYSFAACAVFEIVLRRYRDNPPWHSI